MTEKRAEPVESPVEKEKVYIFKKTWKLFGIPLVTYIRTINEEELADTVSKKVLAMINAELSQRFAKSPRKAQ